MVRKRFITIENEPDEVTGFGPLKSANTGSFCPGFWVLTTE